MSIVYRVCYGWASYVDWDTEEEAVAHWKEVRERIDPKAMILKIETEDITPQ